MRLVEYIKEVINCLSCFLLGNGVNTPKNSFCWAAIFFQMIPSESLTIEEVENNPWDSIFETEPNLCETIRLEQSLAQIDIEVNNLLWLDFYAYLLASEVSKGHQAFDCSNREPTITCLYFLFILVQTA